MAGVIAVNSSTIATTSIGGQGGDGGNGGIVDVDSSGSIATQGGSAYGILAQSIGGGGGGGAGGDSTIIDIELSTNPADYLPFLGFLTVGGSVRIGGSGGAAGNGGQADVTNGGSISTAGFQFDVFQQGGGLYFQAENVVPLPGACLLGFLGLGVAGWKLRKTCS